MGVVRDYTINRTIAEYLRDHGISQSFVSKKTGIEKNRLSRIMNSKATIYMDDLFSIINAAGMPLEMVIEAVKNEKGA